MRSILSLCLLIIALAGPAASSDVIKVFGGGTHDCPEFLTEALAHSDEYLAWVQGYASAFNKIAPGGRSFDQPIDGDLLQRIVEHCHANPGDTFFGAVEQQIDVRAAVPANPPPKAPGEAL